MIATKRGVNGIFPHQVQPASTHPLNQVLKTPFFQ